MKVFEVVFSFFDPTKAMGTIMAESPEEAIEKIKNDIAENSPEIGEITIISVTEVMSHSASAEDLSPERTIN